MILTLKKSATDNEVSNLTSYLTNNHIAFTKPKTLAVIVTPKYNDTTIQQLHPCIESAVAIQTPYQLASKAYKSKTIVTVNGISIGDGLFNIMAGPCSVENEDQIFKTAEFLSKLGVKFIRGGAYKPRTSPYSFSGLGTDGLKLLRKAANAYNLNVVTEILDLTLLDEVSEYADVLQVGSRNMHNFYLLRQLGKTNKPILLKRGFQGKVIEWLLAAEYILSGGNEKIILCERGIRSFDPTSRNVLDLSVVPLINEISHLPIIVDPSHGTGSALRVTPAAMAAAAIGANGILVEVHPNPQAALSDSEQALNFEQFNTLLAKIKTICTAIHITPDTENLKAGRL